MHEILTGRGLEQYYRLRDSAGTSFHPPRPGADRASYAYLDELRSRETFADETGTRMEFYLPEAQCAACVWLTENLPNLDPGVKRVRMNLSRSVAEVEIVSGGSFARVAEALESFGYRPEPVRRDRDRETGRAVFRKDLYRIGVAAVGAGNIMLLSVGIYGGATGAFASYFTAAMVALYLPVLVYSGAPFFRSAWNSLRRRDASSIDVPISLGIGIASIVSLVNAARGVDHIFFDSLSGLIFLLLLSRYILKRVQARALEATRAVHFLTPARATRRAISGRWQEVDSGTLVSGDIVLVRPRELVPADGRVIGGASEISQAWLTGESRAEPVATGDVVCAGSWNLASAIEVKVERAGDETRLGGILRTLESTLRDRSPTLRLLDRVGQIFARITLPLTFLGFWVGYAAGGWDGGFDRALAVAIVICPCAFAFGVPLTLSRALANLAREGILVKGASVLEHLRSIRRVVFDKTGTLTEGRLDVLEWVPARTGLESVLLALEATSRHPVADAVRRAFGELGFRAVAATRLREIPGTGIEGEVNGSVYTLSSDLDGDRGGDSEIRSRIVLRENGRIVGRLTLGDRPRERSRSVVDELRGRGYEVEILSGDGRSAVQALARVLGIEPTRARFGCDPESKAAYLCASPDTLMVGDGANDALALAQARVGLAVQGGMEVAMRAADAFSFNGGPETVLRLIDESERAFARIRRILTFTILYNVVVVSIALAGWLTPLFAAIVMPLSAFVVIALVFFGGRR